MENITAEVIVELYTRYQLLNWWFFFGILFAFLFGLPGIPTLIYSITDWNYKPWAPFITGVVLCMLFLASVIIASVCSYSLNVVLKPEIARYVAPIGLDIIDTAGQEVSAMWNILKNLLNK